MSRQRKIPAYCLHTASGQARVILNGKHIYLGKYGSDESKQKYFQILADWRISQPLLLENPTVAQAAAAYVRFAQTFYRKNGKPTSEVVTIQTAMKRLCREASSLPADKLSPRFIKAIQQRAIADGLSRQTVNKITSRVRRMARWAVSEELIPSSVLISLQAVRDLQQGRTEARESPPVKPVAVEKVLQTLPHLCPEAGAMVLVQLYTGMRPGEVILFRGAELDQSQEVWEYRPAIHKMQHKGRERIICIGPKAQAVLKPWLVHDPFQYVFSPDPKGAQGPYTLAAYRRHICRACEKAFGMPKELRNAYVPRKGIPKTQDEARRKEMGGLAVAWRTAHCWHPNQLRHTFATLARKSSGLEAARVTLGHSSAATSEVYAERDLDLARKVVAEIG